MTRKRLIFLALLATTLSATVITLRSSILTRSGGATSAIGAVDALALQALRHHQSQPRHWRYLMLRQ
jgi:hypothetical protein